MLIKSKNQTLYIGNTYILLGKEALSAYYYFVGSITLSVKTGKLLGNTGAELDELGILSTSTSATT